MTRIVNSFLPAVGGDIDALIDRTISQYTGSAKTIGSYAFAYCSKLTTVSFPACTDIYNHAFAYCSKLTTVNFPSCYYINANAFGACSKLTTVSFPACNKIYSSAFVNCSQLTTLSFPRLISLIGPSIFYKCTRLISLYLMGSSVVAITYSSIFSSTPIAGYSTVAGQYGSIYVPASLLASYQSAGGWSHFSSRFVGV